MGEGGVVGFGSDGRVGVGLGRGVGEWLAAFSKNWKGQFDEAAEVERTLTGERA